MNAHRVVTAVLVTFLPMLMGAASVTGVGATSLVLEPDHVAPGARDVTLVFRLTDGDPAVPATGFRLLLPTGRPLVGVTAPDVPGWSAELTRTTLPAAAPSVDGPVTEVVSAVTWTATGPRASGAVDFTLRVGLMPDGAGPVRFRAACTDAAGNTVEWTDSWAEGGPRPAHDALKLALGDEAGPAVVPAVNGGHDGHHDGGGNQVPLPGEATPAGVVATVGAALATTVVLTATLRTLSRRQHRYLDR